MTSGKQSIAGLPPAVPGTLGETLWLNAWHFGRKIGVATEARTVTHAELYRRGHRIAAGLAGLDLTRDDRFAMLAMNRVEMTEIYAAAEISGIAIVPLNFRLSAAELAATLRDCTPSVLFFEDQYTDTVNELRSVLGPAVRLIRIGADATATPDWAQPYEDFVAAAPEFVAWTPFSPDSLACILYTSGTTGAPKGCMHSHRGFRALSELVTIKLGMTASDRTLVMMPLFHMGGKSVQLGAHWSGGELFVHRGFDPGDILRTIARERITVTHLAPMMIQNVLEHPEIDSHDLSSLRAIFYSAAPMPEPVLRRGLEKLGPVFIQSYGQTEGSGTILPAGCHRLDGTERDRRHLTSVGVPARGVDLKIVDPEGNECPEEVPGEVMLRTACAMTGYWNNPEATRETLQDGWLRTGDIGLLDDEGFLFLVDRKKDVIISGGENIYSREVENAIWSHPEVAEVVVIGVPDPKWGEAVCAIVVREPGSTLTGDGVIEHCRTMIAGYKRPRVVEFADALPKLASGKVDKKALRQSRADRVEVSG